MRPGTKLWTSDDDDALTREVAAGSPIEGIACKIGRTQSAVRSRVYILRLKFGRSKQRQKDGL